MTKFQTYLLAGSLALSASLVTAQTQNPDQQQEKSGDRGATKAHKPQTEVVPPNTGPSPDTQQQSGATTAGKRKKNKNNAHQAHGTPQPQSTKTPQP
jgi:hypothetical protein